MTDNGSAYKSHLFKAVLPGWLRSHNTERPHSALGGTPPISKLTDNLRGNDS